MPLVGTWIEIVSDYERYKAWASCPSWARGLKWDCKANYPDSLVVPLVGTWIEIMAKAR